MCGRPALVPTGGELGSVRADDCGPRSPPGAADPPEWRRAARSARDGDLRSDAEEQVEEPVGELHVAAHGPAVGPTERPEHEAGRVELEVRRQALDLVGLVGQTFVADRDAVVTGVA